MKNEKGITANIEEDKHSLTCVTAPIMIEAGRSEHKRSSFQARSVEESGHKMDRLGMEVYDVIMDRNPSNQSLTRVSSKLGLRRRSISYPDLFEGDISNLMYKKPLSSVFTSSKNIKNTVIEDQDGLTFKIDVKPRRRKLSEKLFSTWFFKKSEDNEDEDLIVGSPEDDKRTSPLSSLVGKQFTAAKDFRHLNVTVPQSM